MMKHTPGPWKAEQVRNDWKVTSDDYGRIVTRICYPDPKVDTTVEADARLIAAAPEMYETLKAIAGRFDATDCDEIFRAHELLSRIEGAE